ncbi:MAG TPA: hypothetical protein VFG83_08180 [Kofleriaceae bacterium]|nr:hypothetical protein [Kofleriaceae bacterium]
MLSQDNRRKKVLCPLERKQGKTYWMRIGSAFTNADGSTNIYLDAYPSNGRLQIRDLDDRDLSAKDGGGQGQLAAASGDVPF